MARSFAVPHCSVSAATDFSVSFIVIHCNGRHSADGDGIVVSFLDWVVVFPHILKNVGCERLPGSYWLIHPARPSGDVDVTAWLSQIRSLSSAWAHGMQFDPLSVTSIGT